MSDTFRKTPRALTVGDLAAVDRIKDTASTLHALFDSESPNRELAIAKTRLEEAVMWAVKGVTG